MLKPMHAMYVCTHAWKCMCVCASVHGSVYFIFGHLLGVYLLIHVSVLVHGPFLFLQIRKLSAKRKFLFLNLART